MTIHSTSGGRPAPDPAVLAKYPRFAQFALIDGLVSIEDLERATALQAQSGGRLGDVLLQCGYLSAGQVGYLRVRLATELGPKPVVPRKVQILGRQMLAQGLASPLMVSMAMRAWTIHTAEGRDVSLAAVSAELKHITAFQQVKLETQGTELLHCARCNRFYQVEGYAPGYRICCLACRQPLVKPPEGAEPSTTEELFFDRDRADELNRFGTLALLRGFATREQLMEAARVQAQQASEEHIGQVLVGLGFLTAAGKASLDDEIQRGDAELELKRKAKLQRMAFGEIALKRGYLNIPLLRQALNSQLATRKRGENVMLGALMEDDRALTRFQVLSILSDQGKRLARCATCAALYNAPDEGPMPACPKDAGRLAYESDPDAIEVAADLCPDARTRGTGKIQRPAVGAPGEAPVARGVAAGTFVSPVPLPVWDPAAPAPSAPSAAAGTYVSPVPLPVWAPGPPAPSAPSSPGGTYVSPAPLPVWTPDAPARAGPGAAPPAPLGVPAAPTSAARPPMPSVPAAPPPPRPVTPSTATAAPAGPPRSVTPGAVTVVPAPAPVPVRPVSSGAAGLPTAVSPAAPPRPVPPPAPPSAAGPRHAPGESESSTPTVILSPGRIAEESLAASRLSDPSVALARLAEASLAAGRTGDPGPATADAAGPPRGPAPGAIRPKSRPTPTLPPVAPSARPTSTPSRGVPTSFVEEIDATMSPVPSRPDDPAIALPSALMPGDESWAPFDTEQALDDGLLEFDEAVTIKFACIQCDKRLKQQVATMDGRGRCPRCRAPVLRVEPLDAHLLEIVCRCGATVGGDDARCPQCRARIYRRRQRDGAAPMASIPALDAMSVHQLVGLDDSEAALHIGDESSLLRVIDLSLGGEAAGSAQAELAALYQALDAAESQVTTSLAPPVRAASDPARLPLIDLAASASPAVVRMVAPAGPRLARPTRTSRAWLVFVGVGVAALAFAAWVLPRLVERRPAEPKPKEAPLAPERQELVAFEALVPGDLVSIQGTVPWGERFVVRTQKQQAFAVRTPDGRMWWVVDAAGEWSFHALSSRVDPAAKDAAFHVEVVGRLIRSTTFLPPAGLDVAATLFLSERWSRLPEAPVAPYLRRLEASTPGR